MFGTNGREAAGSNSCVVDQDVEPSILRVEVLVSRFGGGWVGNVKFQDVRVYSSFAKLFYGLLPLLEVAGADDDLGGVFQFERGLKSDPAISAGDECNLLRHVGSSPCWNVGFEADAGRCRNLRSS